MGIVSLCITAAQNFKSGAYKVLQISDDKTRSFFHHPYALFVSLNIALFLRLFDAIHLL